MRTVLSSIAGRLLLACSTVILADCGSSAISGGSVISCGSGGGGYRGGSGAGPCDPIKSDCQCSDPLCNKPMYTNCISRAYCCEAFGNIGAR